MFGKPLEFAWRGASVIDNFDRKHTVDGVAQNMSGRGVQYDPGVAPDRTACSVTVRKFRVDLARRLLEGGDVVACDEFTSVVDRQVARIGSHAVQKFIRRGSRKFVAATCHYDLEDWLQPDWVPSPRP